MDRPNFSRGIIDNISVCLFWGLVLAILIGLPSCGLIHAEEPRFRVTEAPRFVVTESPLFRSSVAVDTGSTEQTPPSNAANLHRSGRRPQLLVFTAPDWCAPCRTLDVQLRGLREMPVGGVKLWADEIGPGEHQAIRVFDASCEDSPEMAESKRHKVTSWPTIIRIDAFDKEESRHVGSLDSITISRYSVGKWSPKKSPPVAAKLANGLHSHKCPNARCGFIWWHGGESANKPNAHNCPNCGTAQFEVDHFGGVNTAPAQTQQPKRVGFIRSLFEGG